MLAGRFRDRISILTRTVSHQPLGSSETWSTVREVRWGRLIVMSASARARFFEAYKSEITHLVAFRDVVPLSIADNRLQCKGKTYELVGPARSPDNVGAFTTFEVKEIG